MKWWHSPRRRAEGRGAASGSGDEAASSGVDYPLSTAPVRPRDCAVDEAWTTPCGHRDQLAPTGERASVGCKGGGSFHVARGVSFRCRLTTTARQRQTPARRSTPASGTVRRSGLMVRGGWRARTAAGCALAADVAQRQQDGSPNVDGRIVLIEICNMDTRISVQDTLGRQWPSKLRGGFDGQAATVGPPTPMMFPLEFTH